MSAETLGLVESLTTSTKHSHFGFQGTRFIVFSHQRYSIATGAIPWRQIY